MHSNHTFIFLCMLFLPSHSFGASCRHIDGASDSVAYPIILKAEVLANVGFESGNVFIPSFVAVNIDVKEIYKGRELIKDRKISLENIASFKKFDLQREYIFFARNSAASNLSNASLCAPSILLGVNGLPEDESRLFSKLQAYLAKEDKLLGALEKNPESKGLYFKLGQFYQEYSVFPEANLMFEKSQKN